MMYYLESGQTDPYFNLALEQHIFDNMDREHSYFMLWQNHNSIIVGKNQNTLEEINAVYVKEHGINVARRLSGGGAVYHDLGNLNFTFIADENEQNASNSGLFCQPVAQALISMGIPVEISGRNDMTVEGKKFSGNSRYMKNGRVLHHGTILFDSNLEVVEKALDTLSGKIQSKGLKSVRSRVSNIKPYVQQYASIQEFWAALRSYMILKYDMQERPLTAEDIAVIESLRESVYSRWEWNYGTSPAYSVRKNRRIDGCGSVEILMSVAKTGIIEDVYFHGDFFGNGDTKDLAAILKGTPMQEASIKEALLGVDIGFYFYNLELSEFISMLMM